MFSRSRVVLLTALLLSTAVLATTACRSTNAKPEIRLARSSSADGTGTTGTGNDFASGDWGPGGAPGEGGIPGMNGMFPGQSGFGDSGSWDETGSLANTASTDGIEDGMFVSELEMIHFEFDSDEITPAWQEVLRDHARWINNHSSVMVQVEGHTDPRGTPEYNIALGQRRADSVRNFLVEQGVDPNRLSTLSYGEERPLAYGEDEESHALNRRAMFLVYESDSTYASAGGY